MHFCILFLNFIISIVILLRSVKFRNFRHFFVSEREVENVEIVTVQRSVCFDYDIVFIALVKIIACMEKLGFRSDKTVR